VEWKIATESTAATPVVSSAPIVSSSQMPLIENKSDEQSVSVSEEQKSSTPITEITSEKVQIILEGFVTGNETENLAPEITQVDFAATDPVGYRRHKF
jgi:CCR4-NOT transcriptional regulation complex NOT5 subunit